ncbi:MAG: 30S ribosomal protein S6 [Rhizobiales bacterium]|nr:30S ribosomal protein S6 [Hyphomicrobiales bacterium]
MALYEHIFMVRQDVSSTQVDALTQQFKTILEENQGSIAKTEYWGVRPLAYRVKKNRKAHYTLMNIDAPSGAVKEMERQMSINDDVIRFMTIRVEDHEEDQSVMMRSGRGRDRDDRGPRDRDSRPPRRDDDRPRRDDAPKAEEKPAAEAAATEKDS